MPTRKTTTKRSTSPRSTKAPEPNPFDEFSAAGGMPSVPALPVGELGRKQKGVKELAWGEFDRHVQNLARAITKTFKPEMVVGLVHGGVFVGGALASALKAEFLPLRVTQRSRDGGTTRASDELPAEVAGRKLLIVDDVASSGDSLVFAGKLARTQGAKAIKTAALIARPGRFEPDFVAVTSDEFFVFPWDYQDVVEDRRFDTGEFPIPAAVTSRKSR
ncbi:MAG: phosphoribosyltransferase domain-containing protein [Archangium sp.]